MKKLFGNLAKLFIAIKGGGKLIKGLLKLAILISGAIGVYKFLDTFRYKLSGNDDGIIS